MIHDILFQIQKWQTENRRIAFATVIRTSKHAPRTLGSTLAITEEGSFVGSVSGGCVESTVIQTALEVLADRSPKMLAFGDDLNSQWEVGLSCGGSIEVLVYEFTLSASAVQPGDVFLVECDGQTYTIPLLDSKSPMKLICIGGVHIASELVKLAKSLGYRTTVIDPRSTFLTSERFPQADQLIAQWPQKAFEHLRVDCDTAICALSHDPKIDLPALEMALQTKAFYLGSLGRSTTQAKRYCDLRAKGVGHDSISRIYGPIGLKLGGRAPEEIALSIMAQITAVRYGCALPGSKMSDFGTVGDATILQKIDCQTE
jgi:xanthine dehydrogenase accessory factor